MPSCRRTLTSGAQPKGRLDAGRGSSSRTRLPRQQNAPCFRSCRASGRYDRPPIHRFLIIQFLAVFAERLVARSRDPIVRRYPEPEPALGIGVVKGLFLGIVSWNF